MKRCLLGCGVRAQSDLEALLFEGSPLAAIDCAKSAPKRVMDQSVFSAKYSVGVTPGNDATLRTSREIRFNSIDKCLAGSVEGPTGLRK